MVSDCKFMARIRDTMHVCKTGREFNIHTKMGVCFLHHTAAKCVLTNIHKHFPLLGNFYIYLFF